MPDADTDPETEDNGSDNENENGTDGAINTEHPWLPNDADENFDPLSYTGVRLGTETPMAITPRGGAREVGRSCYQLDTELGTYLIDAGLNQGSGGQFPDFRGLDHGDVDAVILTHAHIDHCGALPVLEARGLLDDDAPVIATQPTAQIAHTLLQDSLKIHRREARQPGREQEFTDEDVAAIYSRFESVGYDKQPLHEFDAPHTQETLTVRFGNAAHLLGSAWVSFEKNGYRVLFSGDLGGRATHLPDIEYPPEADTLVLESTYGALHSHTSMSDARNEVFDLVETAVRDHTPVLIPTFSVGRAQLLMLLFHERFAQLPPEISDRITLVLDGMAQRATQMYHSHITNTDYFSESITNRVVESGFDQPFLPENTVMPETDTDRETILDRFDPVNGTNIPVIVSPSGMLTGGNSPRYLGEFASRYNDARILLTGYQAVGTTGRAIQDAESAGAESASFTFTASPIGTDWSNSGRVTWTRDAETGDRLSRVVVPTEWVTTVNGLSAHASQSELLTFTRDVTPTNIMLVHGPAYAQHHLSEHLAANVASVEGVTRGRLLTPLTIERSPDIATGVMTGEEVMEDNLPDQVDRLAENVAALNEETAAARKAVPTEADIREIVRDEVAHLTETDE